MALDAVGLGDRLRHVPGELSGGQQQRVAIARALVKEPKVLLADEPTGNLDEDTRDEIIGLLETMWRDRGLTMVLVTHDSSIARRAQRIGIMKNGRLSFRQPRQSRTQAARAGAAAAAAQAVPAAAGQAAPAAAAQAAPAPPSDLRAPDLPGLQPADLADTELTVLEDEVRPGFEDAELTDQEPDDPDFEDAELTDLEEPDDPDFEDSDFEDTKPSTADTVTFD
jgi:ABC-type glutathione transport system ATPase component